MFNINKNMTRAEMRKRVILMITKSGHVKHYWFVLHAHSDWNSKFTQTYSPTIHKNGVTAMPVMTSTPFL
jgi:hypothetical protein